jgi:hypothetical protein
MAAQRRTPVRGNKYGARRVTVAGVSFDSAKEALRYAELQMLQKAGEIRNLQRQVHIPLMGVTGPLKTRTGRIMRITVDFSYEDKRLNWATILEDAKGMPTRDYEVRKAVAEAMGLKIVEV